MRCLPGWYRNVADWRLLGWLGKRRQDGAAAQVASGTALLRWHTPPNPETGDRRPKPPPSSRPQPALKPRTHTPAARQRTPATRRVPRPRGKTNATIEPARWWRERADGEIGFQPAAGRAGWGSRDRAGVPGVAGDAGRGEPVRGPRRHGA